MKKKLLVSLGAASVIFLSGGYFDNTLSDARYEDGTEVYHVSPAEYKSPNFPRIDYINGKQVIRDDVDVAEY